MVKTGLIFCALLVLVPSIALAQKKEDLPRTTDRSWFFHVNLIDLGIYPKLITGIDKVPTKIRQVTANPSDPVYEGPYYLDPNFNVQYPGDPNIVGRVVTIPEDHVDVYKVAVEALDFMWDYRKPGSKFEASFGITYNMPFGSGSERGDFGNTREYNYINGGTGRGTGAALVYYSAIIRPNWVVPGMIVELKHQLKETLVFNYPYPQEYHFWKVVGGYRLTPYRLLFTSGWDRNDELQETNRYTAANNFLHQPYVGLEYASCEQDKTHCTHFEVTGGPVFQSANPTDIGSQADIHYANKIWRIAISTGTSW